MQKILNSTTGRIRRAASRVRGGRSHHGYSAVSAVHRPEPVCEVLTKQVTQAGAFSRPCDTCVPPQVCDKVPVKTARYAEVPVCVAVPRYECQPVLREVPDTQCEDETYQKCYKVPNQVTHRRTLLKLGNIYTICLYCRLCWTCPWRPAATCRTRSARMSTSR